MFDLGTQELIVIFIVAFLAFGPKKLPELGRTLGKGMRELKNAMKGVRDSFVEAESDLSGEIKKTGTEIEKVYGEFEVPDLKKEALKAIHNEPQGEDKIEVETEEDSREKTQTDKKDG